MWSSAMASSSPVVTPGRTAARTAAVPPAPPGRGPGGAGVVRGDGVQLTGGDTGARGRTNGGDRPGHDEPGTPHELELVRRLDLDHPSTPLRQQRDPAEDPRGRHLGRPPPPRRRPARPRST